MTEATREARREKPSTVTPIEAELLVDDASQIAWSETADVVVVGWGAAGACAAIEARSQGASVIVIDRFEGGGASALSGGVVYAGGGTPYQQKAGFRDTPEAMYEYLRREVNGVVSDETLMRFCRDSAANLAWLEAQGARFDATMPEHKTSYPPDGVYLYYSGNEMVKTYRGAHAPAPRGHRTVARGQSGATLYSALRDSTLRAGAQPVLQATVQRLVRERGTGRVLGVEVWQVPQGGETATRHAKFNRLANRWRNYRAAKAEQWRIQAAQIERAEAAPRFIRAERAIILAAGGFVFNRQMIKEHAPRYARGWKNGHAGCDGSGIRLGLASGAQAAHLSNVSAWRFITPPYAWPRAMVVNTRGERFCNEEVYGATLGYEMVEHQGGRAWIVLDARLRRQAILQCLSGRLWAFQALPALAMMLFGAKRARSIDKLAARIGADPQTLLATVLSYNAAARGECTDALGKLPEMRAVLDKAPFYAIDLSIGAPMFPLATITTGGLKINEADGHVLDAQGEDIPGLFAAGRTAIGIPSSRYMSGTSLADCVFSGRRAGRAAAFESMEQMNGTSAR
ncbi:FAD-binding protein [Paraburkholderia unamae]|uniref:3-oxo-5alpha-steroid 4-dehydrogenase n=1 Tax=Paraburkholderia unamae TaxID=219649 RepID=A0ABX5KIL7_9BURK|nr:FAD-binding protein [Paraburkholderia unamae]PVX81259.1 3-oxo-5alpha-steroid 4-dehydrogenase [Paraburkholderia unamae]RAR57277.1 3-oxo-5alpha-steroid 4-dehydrogenase [Paraburkholderia unamae]CAG9243593.1 3-oxo-5-alpha-steroid 4-dehydrogenase [Paraburkholderia unamae]